MRWFLILGVLWSVGAGLVATAQEPSTPRPTRQATPSKLGLDELLARWEARGVSRTLDVQFSRIDRSPKWGDETYQGRFVRKSSGRACLELDKVVSQNRIPVERLIRNGERVYQFRFEMKHVYVWPLIDWRKEKDWVPSLQSLLTVFQVDLSSELQGDTSPPFLFDIHVAEAKAAFDMELVNETADDATIKFTPLTPIGKAMFGNALIQLDKRRYVPRAVVLVLPESKNTRLYRFTTLTRDGPVEDESFEFKPLKGWKIIGVEEPS